MSVKSYSCTTHAPRSLVTGETRRPSETGRLTYPPFFSSIDREFPVGNVSVVRRKILNYVNYRELLRIDLFYYYLK